MKGIRFEFIRTLRQIGASIDLPDVHATELARGLRDHAHINRQGREAWRGAVVSLSDNEVADVIRGLVFVETSYKWLGGSAAGAIWLFEELIFRNAPRGLLDEVSEWVLDKSSNPYNPFGTQITLGARNYSEWETLTSKRSQANRQHRESIEALAKRERAERSIRTRRGSAARNSHERQTVVAEELAGLPIDEKLIKIAFHPEYPPQFFPTNIPDSAPLDTIKALPPHVRVELVRRLKGKRRGPWGSFKKRLMRTTGPLWNCEKF